MSQKISELINCKPSGVQEHTRSILGEYIYGSGNTAETTCLEVVLKKGGGNISGFVKKIGDYNFKAVLSEIYHEGYWEDYIDYNDNPIGWSCDDSGNCENITKNSNGTYNYKGKCDAGRTNCVKKYEKVRTDVQNYVEYRQEAVWGNISYINGWQRGGCASSYWFFGWRCSRYNYYPSYGSYWGITGYRSVPVNKQRNVDVYDWVEHCKTEPKTNFKNMTLDKRKASVNSCGVTFPTKKRYIEPRWECRYGSSIADDVNSGKVIDLGSAKDYIEATAKVLTNTVVDSPLYFAVANNKVYLAKSNTTADFINKGGYTQNCPKNGGKVEVYKIDSRLYSELLECCNVNKAINNTLSGVEGFENKYKKSYNWVYTVLPIIIIFIIVLILKFVL